VARRAPDELGARVRKARMAAGLSLAAVAGKDFSRSFLNQIELGKARPSTRTLQIIAERLHRPIEYFLEDPRASRSLSELALTEAASCVRRGDTKRARVLMNDLLAQPRLPLEIRVRAQLIQGDALLRLGQPAEAIKILQSALTSSETGALRAFSVEICDRLGSAYYLQRRQTEAARWYDRALALYDEHHVMDPLLRARLLGHRANLHYVAGAPREAIANYEAAIAAAGRVLDMEALGGIYEGLAQSLKEAGDLGRALSFAQKSLRLFETLNDVRMAAQLRNNMAEILLQQGRPADAERLLLEGATQLKQLGDREMLPQLLAEIAEAALEQEDIARAATEVQVALDSASRSSDPLAGFSAHRVAGRVLHAAGDLPGSGAHFEEAIKIAAGTGRSTDLSRAAYEYGRALEARGDASGAAIYYRRAYEAKLGAPEPAERMAPIV
jgi:HTH-type transcriptional regulator, quorum sensing regulator NprR